jgi:hypothetical protein
MSKREFYESICHNSLSQVISEFAKLGGVSECVAIINQNQAQKFLEATCEKIVFSRDSAGNKIIRLCNHTEYQNKIKRIKNFLNKNNPFDLFQNMPWENNNKE